MTIGMQGKVEGNTSFNMFIEFLEEASGTSGFRQEATVSDGNKELSIFGVSAFVFSCFNN